MAIPHEEDTSLPAPTSVLHSSRDQDTSSATPESSSKPDPSQQSQPRKKKAKKPKNGRKPAVIVIARHASRLDSVDKYWHLTSPTPYDPPLTYGGWTQARALGSRIAGLLNILEQDFESHKRGSSETSTASNDDVKGHPRRLRITIHTSPFLRCLQTAIAIAGGINQQVKPLRHASPPDDRIPYAVRPASAAAAAAASASSRPPLSPNLHPIPEPGHHPQDAPQTNTPQPHQLPGISKCKLKVDPFLGEWLCHEYFEENGVTPPPDSALMLAGAKAELMRHDEQLETGWSAFAGNSHHPQQHHQSTLQANVPLAHRDRSATTSSTHPHISLLPQQGCSSTQQASPPPPLYYIPPTPTYAISFGSLIPPGYVAHARDACVDVDHAWDSMRAPLCWGNGGEYGEEWSRMHDRFGRGLRRLVGWYESGMRDEEERGETAMKRRRQSKEAIEEGKEGREGEEEEEEVDDVVILVSHGAGCNALLGELTGEPVLTDIPLTSLSMAVRKDLIHGDKVSEDGRPVSASSSTSSRSVSMPGSPAQSRRSSLIYYAADPVIASPSFSQPAFRSRSHANSLLSNANSNSFTPYLSRSSSHSSMQSIEHHMPIAAASSKPHDHHPQHSPPSHPEPHEPLIAGTYDLKLLSSTDHLRGPNQRHPSLTRGHPRGPFMSAPFTHALPVHPHHHHHAHSFSTSRPSLFSGLTPLNTTSPFPSASAATASASGAAVSPAGTFLPSAFSSFSVASPTLQPVHTRKASGLWGNTSSAVEPVTAPEQEPAVAAASPATTTRTDHAVESLPPTAPPTAPNTAPPTAPPTAPSSPPLAAARTADENAVLAPTRELQDTVPPTSCAGPSSSGTSNATATPAASVSASPARWGGDGTGMGTPVPVPAQHGLWGSPTLPSVHKRRWTVTERPNLDPEGM